MRVIVPKIYRILTIVIAAFLAFGIAVPKASALGNPVKISNSSNATVFPQIVADSNGYLHITWMEVANDTSIWGGFQNPGILYSRWNGDTWSAPLTISANTGFAEIPSIAADSANTIHVVWDDETYGAGLSKVAYKTRTASGTWSAIETLPTASGTGYNWNSRVAIGTSNVPNVVYSGIETDGSGSALYWTRKEVGGWTTPQLISQDTTNTDRSTCEWSDLRAASSGNLHLIYWCSALGPFTGGIFYRTYTGTWSTPIEITTAFDIEFTRMAVTPAGQVFVTWFENTDSTVHVRWTVSGVWQTETTLASAGDRSFFGFPIMGVTTDSKERAHVGWGEKDAGGLLDLKYRSYVSGVWQAAQDVDLDNNDADSPFVYPDLWDNQHFAWTEKNPATNQWEIYYRVAEGTIQTVPTTGATITANPNNITYVTLAVPSGALSVATQIGIQIGPVPESVNPLQVTIPRAFTFRPNGLVFSTASTATIFYTDLEIGGADERLLKPWIWNSQTNAWEARTGTVNRPQNKISVNLSGFSLYGISAPIVKTTWEAPTTQEKLKQAALLVEFQLAYADGNEIVSPATPEELKLVVKDASGDTIQTLLYEPSGLAFDQGKKRYKGTLNFQKDGYANGDYKLEAYLADSLVGEQSFVLDR